MKKIAMLLAVVATVFAVQASAFADWKVPVSMIVRDPAGIPFENIDLM